MNEYKRYLKGFGSELDPNSIWVCGPNPESGFGQSITTHEKIKK